MKSHTSALLENLRSEDGVEREHAREALVKTGREAVPLLIEMLTDPADQVRWEACKALGSIRDPSAAVPLVAALGDEQSEIRWLAAEALIAIEGDAVQPLLNCLETPGDSANVLHGAHHVLGALKKRGLLDSATLAVLDKLSYLEPNSTAAFSDQAKSGPLSSLARAAGEKNEKPRV
jgi:HEAT repeat protein